ncbi:MAG: DNA-processing protein DprA [Atopobiaceae bacterium]|nr:DNA-processing protein DprA [Atopobiaceae bacterium]
MSSDTYVIERESEYYPESLLDLPKPPELIYLKGNPEVLSRDCISAIGARKSTPYGEAVSELVGRVAADCELVLVSGGAMGCDYAAGIAALNAGGTSVVVAGCGADRVYPSSSRELFERCIATGGAVVSLEKWGTPPAKHTFPKRNHIIAALSKAVVIAEAGLPSGTFQTATVASEIGRDILCVPGSIFSPSSRGTNALIEDGAAIVPDEEALEVLISLIYKRPRLVIEGSDPVHGRVISALIADPMRPEDLARKLGCNVLTVLRTLADNESAGLVVRLADGRYSPTKTLLLKRDDTKRRARLGVIAERSKT